MIHATINDYITTVGYNIGQIFLPLFVANIKKNRYNVLQSLPILKSKPFVSVFLVGIECGNDAWICDCVRQPHSVGLFKVFKNEKIKWITEYVLFIHLQLKGRIIKFFKIIFSFLNLEKVDASQSISSKTWPSIKLY